MNQSVPSQASRYRTHKPNKLSLSSHATSLLFTKSASPKGIWVFLQGTLLGCSKENSVLGMCQRECLIPCMVHNQFVECKYMFPKCVYLLFSLGQPMSRHPASFCQGLILQPWAQRIPASRWADGPLGQSSGVTRVNELGAHARACDARRACLEAN